MWVVYRITTTYYNCISAKTIHYIYLFIHLFIYLFTHIQSTTCCCMINVVHSKATVNSGGRRKKITPIYTHRVIRIHINYTYGQDYNGNYSVHKYLISSFTLVSWFSCIE